MEKNFGEFIKDKRTNKGISLREMASKLNIAPSYLSDIEKGRRYAPDKEKIIEIADILGIHSEERDLLFDLAGKSKDTVSPDLPEYIMENEKVRVLLRKAKDKQITDDKLERIIKMLDKED